MNTSVGQLVTMWTVEYPVHKPRTRFGGSAQTNSVEQRSTQMLNTGAVAHFDSVNMQFDRLNMQFVKMHTAQTG